MRRRTSRLVALVALVVLVVSGCNGSASAPESDRNQTIAEQIAADLDAGGTYTKMSVTYVDDATNDARVIVSFRCDACDGAAVVPAAVEAVWRSRITPLKTITVYGQVLDTTTRVSESFSVSQDGSDLTSSYGERPVESLPAGEGD